MGLSYKMSGSCWRKWVTQFENIPKTTVTFLNSGWLGRAMVLDSFQCWASYCFGRPAVLLAGAGCVGCSCVFFFHLVYPIFPFLMPHLLEMAGYD